jgi:HAD superfamily phosphoserine phosphatase-like hydrolase
MAEPRIFISSTYRDLKDTREAVAEYVKEFGYAPVIFERDDISYEPNKLLEDSCYEEIKSCSLMILLIKNNYGSFSKTFQRRQNNIDSVTKNEYYAARDMGIPIFIFIEQTSIDEYNAYMNQGKPKDFTFRVLENSHLADFIKDIYQDKSFRFIHTYQNIADIKLKLKKQWAGLFNKYLLNAQKYSLRKNDKVYVNSFKLFYFRRFSGLSQEKLAKVVGMKANRIQTIEDAGIKKNHIEIEDFEAVTLEELQRIADALGCSVGNLKAGLPDDFLSQYLLYYFKNKGTQQRKKVKAKNPSLIKSKVVLFDFDGTLTKSTDNLTTWEHIWLYQKYDINECADLHRKYSISEITHKKWCELTEKKFKAKNLHQTELNHIADDIKLIDGTREVIEELVSKNVKLYILSGSIKYIIRRILGDLYQCFEGVKANDFIFDNNGFLQTINGTKYDFEGKADFISQIVKESNINPFEAFFVGNSQNDEWAHQSGAQTLCVNPRYTNPDHPFQWTYSINNMNNLKEIFRYLIY